VVDDARVEQEHEGGRRLDNAQSLLLLHKLINIDCYGFVALPTSTRFFLVHHFFDVHPQDVSKVDDRVEGVQLLVGDGRRYGLLVMRLHHFGLRLDQVFDGSEGHHRWIVLHLHTTNLEEIAEAIMLEAVDRRRLALILRQVDERQLSSRLLPPARLRELGQAENFLILEMVKVILAYHP